MEVELCEASWHTQKLPAGWLQAPSNTVYPNGEGSESKHSPHSQNNSPETTSPFILCPTSLNWPGRNRNNPVTRKVGSGVTSGQVCKPAPPQTLLVTLGKLVTLPQLSGNNNNTYLIRMFGKLNKIIIHVLNQEQGLAQGTLQLNNCHY